MASPIHKFLFSPPPSPPGENDPSTPYSSHLQTLVSGLAPRSGSSKADADSFPLSLPVPPMRSPSPLRRSSSPRSREREIDIEAGHNVAKSYAQRTPIIARMRLVVQALTPNIPRPVIRLFAFVGFLFIFVTFVSSVVLPALSPLPQAPPVAKKPQWTPKAYVPPQANSHPLVAREYIPLPNNYFRGVVVRLMVAAFEAATPGGRPLLNPRTLALHPSNPLTFD